MARIPYLFSLPALLALTVAATLSQSYTLTDDYAIRVSTRGVSGTFGDLRGTVVFDADDLGAAHFDVSVATASVATGNKTQDKHARGDSWLDAEAHPRIRFVSTAFERREVYPEPAERAKTAGGYTVDGNFTINGETHAETIPFTFDGETFVGTVAIARERYGISGPRLFGGLVGDEVTVEIRVGVK